MNTPNNSLDQIPVAQGTTGSEVAAQLLAAPAARTGLNLDEARVIAGYMTARFIPAETTFIREGDASDSGFMALLIDGDVVVERVNINQGEPVTIRVMGSGSLIGEIGLVDSEPRSASCTAATDVWCAILTREGVDRMIQHDPVVAARLLLGVSANIAELLRDTTRQLKLYARLATAMREELSNVSTPAAPRADNQN